MKFLTIAIVVLHLSWGSMAQAEWNTKSVDGSYIEGALIHDGLTRTYYMHKPAHLKQGVKVPLLLALHGGGKDDGKGYSMRTRYNALADRQGFIVVYPNGIEEQWNDGRGETFRNANNTNVDDSGYLAALIDALIREQPINPGRVFMEGTSNGGMMTHRFMCEHADKIAGAAAVIANMPKEIRAGCQPERPVPFMLINGTEDPLVPYNGGAVTIFRKEYGEVISTEENIAFWREMNRCKAKPKDLLLKDRARADSSVVRKITYEDCADGARVVLYKVEGGGHSRPGAFYPIPHRIVGPNNKDLNTDAAIWEFFRQIP